MTQTAHAPKGLKQLLKLARGDADALRIDLVDIEQARDAAETSLTGLADAVRREEAAITEHSGADLAPYIEGVRARRLNLQTTLMTLTEAEESARDRLEAALIEIKKLEHLIDLSGEAAKKAARRDHRRQIDEIAARRQAL